MRSSLLIFPVTLALLLSTATFAWLSDTTAVDCIQSTWSVWRRVGFNTRLRTRVILRHPSNGGTLCGSNTERQELQLAPGETITPEETAVAFDTFFLKGSTSFQRNPARERDLLIIMDESGSIGQATFDRAKESLADVLQYICPGIGLHYPYHRVAFMTFSSSYREHFDFDEHATYQTMRDAIMQLPFANGGTATDAALDYARTYMFADGNFAASTKGLRTDSLKEVLLITDGHPNNADRTVAAAARLRNIGVTVFALGIGSIDQNHMEQIISSPAYQHIFHLSSFDDFHTMVTAVEAAYNSGEPCVSLNPFGRRRR